MKRVERVSELKAAIKDTERQIVAAIADYPGMQRYLAWLPHTERRIGVLADFPRHMWAHAAGRVSEAYGIGRGQEWLVRHGVVGSSSETRAEAQVMMSVGAVMERR
jgi:hypothetical protein